MGKKTQTRTSPVTSAAGNSPPTIPVADGPDPDMASQPSPQGRKHRSRGREKNAVSQQDQNTSTRPKAASTVVKEEMGTSNGTRAAISTDRSAAGRSSRKRRKTGPGEQSQVDTDENNTAVGKQLSHKTRQKSSERAVRTEVQSSTPPDAQGRGKKRKAPPSGAGRNDNKADKSVNGSSGSGPSQKKRRHNRGSSPASAQGRSLTEGASCFSASGAATSDVQEVAATSRSPCKSKENKKKGGARKEKESSLQTSPCKGNRTESKVTGKDGGAAGSSSSAKGRKRKKKKRQGSKPELGTEEARATRTETPAEPAEAEKCAICLEELTDQRVGTPSCCQHSYCLDCIQTWAQRKNKCPVDNKTFHEIVAQERLGGAITNRIPAPDRNEVHPEDDDDLFTINIDGEEVNILEQLNGYFLRYQEGWDHWDDDDDDDESGWVSVDEDGDDSDDDDDEDDSDEDSYSDDSSDEDRDNSEGGSYSASEGDWTFFDDNYDGSDRGGSSDEADSDSDSHDSSGEDDDETLYSGYDDDYGPATDYNDGSPYSNQDGSSEEASSYDEYYENGDDHNDGYNNEYGDDGYDAYSNGYYDHGYNNYDDYEGNYYDGYDHGYNDQSNNEDYYDDGYDCGYGNNYSDRSDQDSDESSDTGSSDW